MSSTWPTPYESPISGPMLAAPSPIPLEGLDWREVIRAWLRAAWIIVPFALLGAIGAFALSYLMTPVYTASGVLILDRPSPGTLGNAADVTAPDAQQRESMVKSQLDILRSNDVVSRVIDQLHLASEPMFNPPPTLSERISGTLTTLLGLPQRAEDTSAASVENRIIPAFLDRLTISQEPGTYILQVGFRAPDPALAARVVNAEIQNYVDWQREQKVGAINGAQSWLRTAVDSARERVIAAEDAVQAFNKSGVVLNVEGRTALDQGLAQLTADYAAAQARLVEAQARADEIRHLQQTGQVTGIAAMSGSRLLQDLQSQYAAAHAGSAALGTAMNSQFPTARAAGAKDAELRSSISRAIGDFVQGENSQATIARATVANLSTALAAMKEKVIAAGADRAKLQRLQGVVDAERASYLTLLTKQLSYDNVARLAYADVTVLSKALPPLLPQSPRRSLMGVFGALIAAMMAAIVVAWRVGRRDAVRHSSDAVSLTGLTCIGVMPRINRRDRRGNLDPRDVDHGFFRQELRSICAILVRERELPRNKGVTVMVTSCLPGEGKSTFCMELATLAAQAGIRTLLVRTDLPNGRRDKDKEPLRIDPLHGKDSTLPLFGVDWVVPTTMLDGSGPARFIDAWRDAFGLVVFDTPPVSAMAESVIVAPLVDSTILLARVDRTPRSLLGTVTSQIEKAGGRLAGFVLTFVQLDRHRGTVPSDLAHYARESRSYYQNMVVPHAAGRG